MNKLSVFILYFLSFINCFGQSTDEYKPFNSSDYLSDNFQIKLYTTTFSKFQIEIRQVQSADHSSIDSISFSCRGWLVVKEGSKIISKRFFNDIESVGDCAGLFIPYEQQRKDLFIFSKFEGYGGSIFLIDTTGKVMEEAGGAFYISEDKHYLFSMHASDEAWLTVYDLNKKRVLFSDTIESYLDKWFLRDNQYFASVSEDETQKDKVKIATFDFINNKLIFSWVDKKFLKKDNELRSFNDDLNSNDCNCGR